MNQSFGQSLVQILFVLILLGGVYNLWRTAKTYGGLIGRGLKWLGLGIIIFSIEALDRVMGEFSFVDSLTFVDPELAHNFLLLLGLLFSAFGFSVLQKIGK